MLTILLHYFKEKGLSHMSQIDKILLTSLTTIKLLFSILQFIVIQYLSKESDILFCSITHANLGQILKPGTDLESAGPEVFKTPPTCPI